MQYNLQNLLQLPLTQQEMRATVLYYSHKGKTASYAREIAMFLWSKGLDVSLSAMTDFDAAKLRQTDLLISGCWTCGWFVVGQHPHKKWVEASKALSRCLPPEKTMFFTTYKIRTGLLFRRMKRAMSISASSKVSCLKSKTGRLTDNDRAALNRLIGRQDF